MKGRLINGLIFLTIFAIGWIAGYGLRNANAHTPCYNNERIQPDPVCRQQAIADANGGITYIYVCD